jgi:tryptophanyl-tRNA synthetase
VVDLHAITVKQDPKKFKDNIYETVATFVASGIDPQRSIIFNQSKVSAHSEAAWILSCVGRMGWLNRMTQFKEKAGKDKEKASVGLYSYPILMSADILLYDSIPEPLIKKEFSRIMSLKDGQKKMSKSELSDMSRINLTDNKDQIINKIKKAKTDPLPMPSKVVELEKRLEAKNLIGIYSSLTDTNIEKTIDLFAGKNFSNFKEKLAEVIVDKIDPISSEIRNLLNNKDYLNKILEDGSNKANEISSKKIKEIHKILGF